jgi:hypothetical protein
LRLAHRREQKDHRDRCDKKGSVNHDSLSGGSVPAPNEFAIVLPTVLEMSARGTAAYSFRRSRLFCFTCLSYFLARTRDDEPCHSIDMGEHVVPLRRDCATSAHFLQANNSFKDSPCRAVR